MNDIDKWLEYQSRISMGLGLEEEQIKWIFDKAKEGIDLAQNIQENKETIECVSHKLNEAINEINYALSTKKPNSYSDFYTKNAIQFIQEAKEDIQKLEKK